MNKQISLKLLPISFILLTFILSVSYATTPAIQIQGATGYGFIKKSSIGVTNRATLRVSATGAASVARVFIKVGGVLFQATAQPSKSLANKSIDLSFDESKNSNSLVIDIGNKHAVSHTPAWIWVLAAKFADSTDTAALSLYGRPDTPDEIKYHKEHKPRFWVEYHPVLDDTLIGMMIFAVDGMFVDVKPERLRDITQSFTNRKTYFGEIPRFDNNKSLSASIKITKILTKQRILIDEYKKLSTYLGKQIIEFKKIKNESKKVKFAMTLKDDINRLEQIESDFKKYEWSTYMMNDVSSNFKFNVDNGILNIDGVPNYHFGISEGENFTEADIVTNLLIENRSLFNDLNPFIYSSVDKFSKLVSFFNYVEKNDPDEWKSFIIELRNKDFSLPVIDTPAAWNPS